MALILFVVLSFLVLYVYAGYPVVLWLIGTLRRRRVKKRPFQPSVTIIIPAYNEATVIRETVLNKLECAYPEGKREIVVISDGSDDGTDEIVRAIGHPSVRVLRQEPRQGKTSALNRAVKLAKGEIIIFSDANSLYRREATANLVSNFADPAVGYVTGAMGYSNPDGSGVAASCGAYMRYENALRMLENRCGSIVGVDGAIDAMRKDLYVEMPPDILPDLVLPLLVIEQGYRVVYEPGAIVAEDALSSSQGEFRMRVRVTLRALHAMWYMRRLFNPLKYGLFSFQLLSHKLLRYSIPFMLVGLLIVNVSMIGQGPFWGQALIGQCLFYGTAVLGYILLRLGRRLPSVAYFPFYFVLVNFAALVAWVQFFRRTKRIVWAPRRG